MRVKTTALSVPIFLFVVLFVNFAYKKPNVMVDIKTTTNEMVMIHREFTAPPFRHVTKSLDELGPMDDTNSYILFFNRIPKSGSEVLVILIQWLQGPNNFRHVRLKDENKSRVNQKEMKDLVDLVEKRARNDAVPLCFDKPIHFVNFSVFDGQSPTYINLIRDPVDNFVARYQFMSTTANPQDRYASLTMKNRMPIEKCITTNNVKCNPIDGNQYDFSISYFCGNDERCGLHNNKWALNTAKLIVEKYYPVVGVLDELNATLAVLEKKIPYFFKGVQEMYHKDLLEQHHINVNERKLKVTKSVRKYLKRLLITEYEFYEWIKSRLFNELI
nr:uronyl 2-sulfotransferase-like [Onthophagus taurus]